MAATYRVQRGVPGPDTLSPRAHACGSASRHLAALGILNMTSFRSGNRPRSHHRCTPRRSFSSNPNPTLRPSMSSRTKGPGRWPTRGPSTICRESVLQDMNAPYKFVYNLHLDLFDSGSLIIDVSCDALFPIADCHGRSRTWDTDVTITKAIERRGPQRKDPFFPESLAGISTREDRRRLDTVPVVFLLRCPSLRRARLRSR
jgi:hypothetical protein